MKYLRLLVIILLAFILAYALPAFPNGSALADLSIAAAVIFAALFGIFAALAVSRRERLKEAIALELNKVRRIYHLGKNLSNGTYIRAWFTQLHGFVYEYLGSFEKLSIVDYEKGNAAFRKMAYHIYALPEIREVKEEALYNALVAAAGEVSEARQKIGGLVKARFYVHHWLALAVALVLFVISVLAAGDGTMASRLIVFAVLALGMILADVYLTHDLMTAESGRRLAAEYVKNIGRLELRRD